MAIRHVTRIWPTERRKSPGAQGNRKAKNLLVFGPLFLGRAQVHMQKQNKTKQKNLGLEGAHEMAHFRLRAPLG